MLRRTRNWEIVSTLGLRRFLGFYNLRRRMGGSHFDGLCGCHICLFWIVICLDEVYCLKMFNFDTSKRR
jgi:hypothetical protein